MAGKAKAPKGKTPPKKAAQKRQEKEPNQKNQLLHVLNQSNKNLNLQLI